MTTDLKQIDNEMQAILAELLMPGPQPAAVQPPPARMPFPLPTASPVPVPVMTDVVDSSQPHVVQLMQPSGALLISLSLSLSLSHSRSGRVTAPIRSR